MTVVCTQDEVSNIISELENLVIFPRVIQKKFNKKIPKGYDIVPTHTKNLIDNKKFNTKAILLLLNYIQRLEIRINDS